jgi:hypothetical protein
MDRKQDDHEMSMEEILASIRKYVTEDPSDTSRSSMPHHVSDNKHSNEEVLDLKKLEESLKHHHEETGHSSLTQEALSKTPYTGSVQSPYHVEPHYQETKETVHHTPHHEPAPMENSTQSLPQQITSGQAMTASAQALSKLLEAKKPKQHTQPHGDPTMTLEELVSETIKPMLRQWLDANLPTLVEKIVQQEIEKISREISA